MSVPIGWLWLLAAAAFLSSAKTHGRQLRLERELQGYHHVVFGGENPPFVEALWRRDRYRYWVLTLIFAVLSLSRRPLGQTGVAEGLLLYAVLPMSAAFISVGLASLMRWTAEVRAHAPPELPPHAITAAAWGSAGWFVLALTLTVPLALFSWRVLR